MKEMFEKIKEFEFVVSGGFALGTILLWTSLLLSVILNTLILIIKMFN